MDLNQFRLNISPSDLSDIINALATLKVKLLPHLAFLSEEERRSLPKMKDLTTAFVHKSLEHAELNANLVPPYIDVATWKEDLTALNTLSPMLKQLVTLSNGVEHTMMRAGAEAYSAARNFYDAAKNAKKARVRGAEEIVADLKPRFERRAAAEETDDTKPETDAVDSTDIVTTE